MIVSLNDLDEEALIKIVSEPKNALIKQYQKLFQMDGVKLTFERDALSAVAELALKQGTGARGLRAIMENLMMQTMYEIPSRKDVCEVKITADAVRGKEKPKLILLRDTQPQGDDKAC